MPIVSKWDNNEKTIVRITFVDDWSWDDFPESRQQLGDMLTEVDHIVDFIADFRHVTKIPQGALSVGRSIRNRPLPNEGIAFIVGISPILRMLYQSFITAFPSTHDNYQLVGTIDEAYQAIAIVQQQRCENG